jgi:Ni2+-binding GTPase involved in maturation of urease and hydrogenase
VILTGPVGIGKSALLWAALENVGKHIDWLIMLRDHQAKRSGPICLNSKSGI